MKYKDQLPRYTRWTWGAALNGAGSVASLIGIGLYFSSWWDTFSKDGKYAIGVTYLFLIIVLLLTYILLRESSKRHRFAQAIYHIHFVNHLIRDYLAGLQIGKEEPLSGVLSDIVSTIAAGFSIIEGRQCRCSIKEVTYEARPQIVTKARDAISKTQSVKTEQYKHYLEENTDFYNLWNGLDGNVRFFKGVNLKKMWCMGNYKNSSFVPYGTPSRSSIFGIFFVTNWHLPYNSTMVWPIRFIPDHTFWPPAAGATNAPLDPSKQPDIWGFLCVDADTSRGFRSQQSAELGALFADALYTLFKQVAYIANASAKVQAANADAAQGAG